MKLTHIKSMKRLFILMAAVAVCFGCKTEDTPGNPYRGDDYAYLTGASATYEKSWWGNSQTAEERTFKIKTVGYINEEKDREVKIDITSDVEGLPIDQLITVTSCVIPKGESEITVTVTLHNLKDYFLEHKNTKNLIKLTIKENDNFKVWPITETGTLHELQYTLSISSSYN